MTARQLPVRLRYLFCLPRSFGRYTSPSIPSFSPDERKSVVERQVKMTEKGTRVTPTCLRSMYRPHLLCSFLGKKPGCNWMHPYRAEKHLLPSVATSKLDNPYLQTCKPAAQRSGGGLRSAGSPDGSPCQSSSESSPAPPISLLHSPPGLQGASLLAAFLFKSKSSKKSGRNPA